MISTDAVALAADYAFSAIRFTLGATAFYHHGLHKLVDAKNHLMSEEPWPLLEEVSAMGLPLPLAAALFATAAQSFGALSVALGIWVLPMSAIVVASLGGAIAQNLLAGESPQLAVVYALAFALCGVQHVISAHSSAAV